MTAPVNQSVDLEAATVGAVLVNEEALQKVVERVELAPSEFGSKGLAVIYEVARDLHRQQRPTDELSVVAALEDRGELEAAGGRHRVSELTAKAPAPANAKHYAEELRKLALQRKSREIGLDLAEGLEPDVAIKRLTEVQSRREGSSGQITTVLGSDIRLRVPRFLDATKMLPDRSITVLFGPGGLGKTVYSLNQCAAVTKGRMEGLDGPAPVLISSLEDDAEAVLGPRLVAAGADLSLVHFVSGLSLPSQVPALASRAKAIKAALVVIDPISAHLDPDIDSHRDASIRTALAPLAEAAQELELAVLVVCHPNKASSATGLNRISGSGAFGNAARSVIVFGLDPGDPDGETGDRRIIAHMKCNVGKRAPSISAELVEVEVETDDGPADVPRIEILGFSDHSADDVLSSPTSEERSERDEAREFLTAQLADTPVRSNEIKAAAEKQGLSWRTVQRAKRDMGLKAKQGGDGWYWLPPGQDDLGGAL